MADIETVRIIKIETEGSERTVKDLRNEIKSLRDDLVNVDKGTEQYDEIVKKLISDEQKLTDVMRAGKNEVSAATGSYNALQNELTSLRKVWKEVTDESQRQEIGKRIAELNTELKNMDASIGNFQRNVGNYENAIRNVTTEYVSQKKELKELKLQLEQLEPGTEAYNKAFTRAAEITHNLAEQQEMLKYSSTDLGDQLNNIRGIATNMVAGFSAVNAAMGLFGAESEDVQKAMLKVQQGMALVQGLQGIDGFLKRTQGLSTALKKWVSDSKAVTVQTTAQATATNAAATATNAETVATEGATVAQKGLNAAMKANPIGFLLGLLALLIANWKKVTEWIGKAVGGFEKFNKIVNKTKQVISGVANVIAKGLLVPVKEAINYVATLGKVLKDVFTLNWDNIGKDIKEGIGKSVDIVKDGFDVVANYAEGKENEITRQQEKEIKERAIKRASELEDIIAENDAKYGSDWKYTEEAKKLYDELFDNRMLQYKKDSKEYKEAQNDKLRYDREFTEHQEKAKEEAQKKAAESAKKQAEAAKKAQEALKKIDTDFNSKVAKNVGNAYAETIDTLKEQYDAFIDYYNKLADEHNLSNLKDKVKENERFFPAFYADGKKLAPLFDATERELITAVEKLTGNVSEKFKKQIKQTLKFEPDEIANLYIMPGDRGANVKAILNAFGVNELEVAFEIQLERLKTYRDALLKDAIEQSGKERNKQLNDQIIQMFQKTIIPNVDEELTKLQGEIDKKTIKIDFEVDTGYNFDEFVKGNYIPVDEKAKEFEKAAEIYSNALDQLEVKINYYQQTVDFVKKNGLIPSEEYENAVAQLEALNNLSAQTQIDYFNTQAEIRRKYFDRDLALIQQQTETELRENELKYNELYTQGNDYYNYRVTQTGLLGTQEIEAAERAYQIQKDGLQKQIDLYNQQLNEQTLTAQERIATEQMVAELTAEIEEGEVAHTIQMNELRSQSWNQYFSLVQDGLNGIGNLFGSLADLYEADIKAKRDNNKMSQEEYEKAFESVKGIKIAEATMSMISGALGAFMQGVMSYPPPFGEILGGIGAAAALATGAAQIIQIKNQKPDGSGSSVSAAATPQVQSFTPEYVENPTGDSELTNLRNSMYEQPIRAYVVESDITDAQKTANTRREESSF